MKARRGDILDQSIPHAALLLNTEISSFLTCYRVQFLIRDLLATKRTYDMASAVASALLTMIFSLPTDKTKDLYHEGVELDHSDFRYGVIK